MIVSGSQDGLHTSRLRERSRSLLRLCASVGGSQSLQISLYLHRCPLSGERPLAPRRTGLGVAPASGERFATIPTPESPQSIPLSVVHVVSPLHCHLPCASHLVGPRYISETFLHKSCRAAGLPLVPDSVPRYYIGDNPDTVSGTSIHTVLGDGDGCKANLLPVL